MFDDDLLDMLIDPNPEVRKRGVKQMAQTLDPEALPYLAEVYRDDDNAEVRDLARKAGQYIQKNAKTTVKRTPPPASPVYDDDEDDDDLYGGGSDDLYASYDDGEDDIEPAPLPSEIRVSDAKAELAKGMVKSALDLNMRGENEKATKTLSKALHLDPRLMYDSYTVGLAGTITGGDGKEAVERLGPNADQLHKMKSASASSSSSIGSFQRLMGIGVMFGSVVVLVAYFMFPWVDLSSVEVIDETTNQQITLREQLDQAVEEVEAAVGDQDNEILDAMRGIRVDFTGLETTTITLGMQDILDVMGFTNFFEVMFGDLGVDFAPEPEADELAPEPLDYSLPLIPIMSIIALLLSFNIMRTSKISNWLFAGLIGLIGMGPMIYFYLSAVTNFDVDTVASANEGVAFSDFSAIDLIGMGYWVGLIGMVLILVLPFIGLITMPESK